MVMEFRTMVIIGLVAAAVIIIAIIALAGLRTVPTGEVGIKLLFNNAVGQVGSGLQIINPFTESLVLMDTKVLKDEETAAAATKDLQTVQAAVAVNYNVDPSDNKALALYKKVGLDYLNRIVNPAIQETVKQVTSTYNAAELITKRGEVATKVADLLKPRMSSYGINIQQVSIVNIDFSAEFDKKIEETAQAQQNEQLATNQLRVAQIEAQKQIVNAEAQKNATIAQSRGIAESTEIRATGESNAIAKITAVLNNNTAYIKYLETLRWNGMYPLFGNGPANGGGMDMIFTPDFINTWNITKNLTPQANITSPMPSPKDQSGPTLNINSPGR